MIDKEQLDAELKWLRQLYLEDLTKMVNYGGNDRPRVRHPGKWERLDTVHFLGKGIKEPLQIEDRNVWIWSDQHFYHKNIIEFSERPFDDVNHMNEIMIANYNEYVGEDDVCLWVGDVGFKGNQEINKILNRCNGYKILIIGNHDFKGKNVRQLDFDEIHLMYLLNYIGTAGHIPLVLTHYPMFNIEWPWFNLHGHLHAFPEPDTGHPLHYNVNCELHNYRPINIRDELLQKIEMRIEAAK